jgi:glycosyltransferase involved in cell wall biosynthesis
MAGLLLGVPTITNDGPLTERLWRDGDGVALAGSVADVVRKAEELMKDRPRAAELATRGRALYETHFALSRTIETLRGPAPGGLV